MRDVRGRAQKPVLTAREGELCAGIGPRLREQGLVFGGIDVIGDYMTEINVTSPTGIQEIARLDGVDLAPKIWDAIEARFAARRLSRPARSSGRPWLKPAMFSPSTPANAARTRCPRPTAPPA